MQYQWLIPCFPPPNYQQSVVEWLQRLELDEYTELFHAEGYRTEDDIENLKELTQERFVAMGIHKRGEASSMCLDCILLQQLSISCVNNVD